MQPMQQEVERFSLPRREPKAVGLAMVANPSGPGLPKNGPLTSSASGMRQGIVGYRRHVAPALLLC